MTRYEFQQIIQRDRMAAERDKNAVGVDWLEPYLILEAEQDRRALIKFSLHLAKKLREANETR